MLLNEYIDEQVTALKELGLWKYMSEAEQEELMKSPNDARSNIIVRTVRDKYWDIMLEEYENGEQYDGDDIPIEELDLKTKTKFALLRSGIATSREFVEFVQDYGWSQIPGFGVTAAKDVYAKIYDKSEEELEKLIKSTRIIKEEKI